MDPTDQFFANGCQYYVVGRYSAFAGLTPVVGNLLHHAIEMFLKGALANSMTLEEMRSKLRHNLPKIWETFQATANDPSLDAFDSAIASLDEFEEIRYPDKILSDGAHLTVDITKAAAAEFWAWSTSPMPKLYRLCLEEIDELVAMLFVKASRNPQAFLRFIKPDARQYLNQVNASFNIS